MIEDKTARNAVKPLEDGFGAKNAFKALKVLHDNTKILKIIANR